MRRIGVRDLRQNAGAWLRQAERGESLEVTDRGRPVALLIPWPARGELDRLAAAGLRSDAEGDVLDLGAPLPPKPGVPRPSTLLERARADER